MPLSSAMLCTELPSNSMSSAAKMSTTTQAISPMPLKQTQIVYFAIQRLFSQREIRYWEPVGLVCLTDEIDW